MAIIKFHYPDEFIDELKKEPLAKPVVRLTNLRRTSEKFAPLASLIVVATAKAADGDIIRLEHYCGQLWGHKEEDEKTWALAKNIGDHIRDVCKNLKLEVRAGIYEQGDKDHA